MGTIDIESIVRMLRLRVLGESLLLRVRDGVLIGRDEVRCLSRGTLIG